jgi:5-methylthioribose kinase
MADASASDTDLLMSAEVTDYLRAADVLPDGVPAEVSELGGGVSNVVLRVSWPSGCVVVKQSLPKLRVPADWAFDRKRTLVERDCLSLLSRLVPGCVPDVVMCDERRLVLVISCVPAEAELWKASLMAGRVEPVVAARAGELLGEIHRSAAADRFARSQFDDQTVLIQGRTDPFHLTVAASHPELAPAIESEVERMLATRATLTLGDYSPKNIFVLPNRVMAIDLETAHWGDPAFDVAFCLTHLILKAFRFPSEGDKYLAAAARFWARYRARDGGLCGEPAVVSELGCLLLARMDGKSPVDYITSEDCKDRIRRLAAELIGGGGDSLPAALASALAWLPSAPEQAQNPDLVTEPVPRHAHAE